ncbi:MAG TPA: hypothetical protein VLU46_07105, partial [Thermoanaerobaculia bacterium]|nr:hypothetical protein [Thermoanaerobaculia bacterium]
MYRRALTPVVATAALLALMFVVPVGGATEVRHSEERVFMRGTTISSPVHGNVQVYGGTVAV